MGSPFARKGSASTAARPPAAAPASLPGPDNVTDIGADKPVGKGVDPFSAGISDPTGVSGYKPIAFMAQMVLMHPTETGEMKTSSNTPENPTSEYVRFDIVPLTAPQPSETGTIARTPAVLNDDGNVAVLNKDIEVEVFEPYEVGDRLDDVLVFNKPLVREGKKALENGTAWLRGRIMLGQKKQGQSPPVILVVLDDEDLALYNQILPEVRKKLAAGASK